MQIADFLSPDDALCDVRAADKDRLLRELTGRAASALRLDAAALADAIAQRERLGSTGMGDGIAIPHARIAGLSKPFGVLARLRRAIDFAAIDGQPVDIVFLLLLPSAAHGEQLTALASVARRLRDAQVTADLRDAADGAALYRTIVAEPRARG
jgi:PTS system nitrogen regulatory IIA component